MLHWLTSKPFWVKLLVIPPIMTLLLVAAFQGCSQTQRPSCVGDFIPPAHGVGELCSISEEDGVFSIKVLDQNESGNSSIWNNATDEGLLVLAIRDDSMLKELEESYRIGDIIAVEYPMAPDVLSDDGQITCVDIDHAPEEAGA